MKAGSNVITQHRQLFSHSLAWLPLCTVRRSIGPVFSKQSALPSLCWDFCSLSRSEAAYPAPDPQSSRKWVCIIVAGIHLFTCDSFMDACHMLGPELGYVDAKMNKVNMNNTGSQTVLCQEGYRPAIATHGQGSIRCSLPAVGCTDGGRGHFCLRWGGGQGREVWCRDSQRLVSGPSHQHQLGTYWKCKLSAQPRRPESKSQGRGPAVWVLRSCAEKLEPRLFESHRAQWELLALSPVPLAGQREQLLQELAANPSQLLPSLETCPPPGSSLTCKITAILHPHRHRLQRARPLPRFWASG